MIQKNTTTAELRDRAATLRLELETMEAEIAEREKSVDWPTAQYVWGVVVRNNIAKSWTTSPTLLIRDDSSPDGNYVGGSGWLAREWLRATEAVRRLIDATQEMQG